MEASLSKSTQDQSKKAEKIRLLEGDVARLTKEITRLTEEITRFSQDIALSKSKEQNVLSNQESNSVEGNEQNVAMKPAPSTESDSGAQKLSEELLKKATDKARDLEVQLENAEDIIAQQTKWRLTTTKERCKILKQLQTIEKELVVTKSKLVQSETQLQLMREDYMDRDDIWENDEVTALRQTMLEMQKEVSQMRVEATISGMGGSKSGKRGPSANDRLLANS